MTVIVYCLQDVVGDQRATIV